jgi:glycosyltransferase involved in cell wall biosynthesis
MNDPAVSVIVPVLNTRPFLDECLDSLLVQTLSSIEIICVDNGSNDGSMEKLRDYAQRDGRVRIMEHPTERRQGGARNKGMDVARGKYIGFVDSDDFVAPEMIEKLYNVIEGNAADLAVCNISLCYPDGGYKQDGVPRRDLKRGCPFVIRERPRLLRNLTICNKLFSQRLIHKHGIRFPEGQYHEDQFFVIAAFVHAHRIVSLPESLYFYRKQRPGSVNEYHGADNLHVFHVMDKVSTFLRRSELGIEYQRLIDEVKTLKYLQLYQATGAAYRKGFYQKMREEFKQLALPSPGQILSVSEHREFRVVCRYGYAAHSAFIAARTLYGHVRARVLAGRTAASGDSKG